MIPALEVEENFFLVFSIALLRASCTFPELLDEYFFLPVYLEG